MNDRVKGSEVQGHCQLKNECDVGLETTWNWLNNKTKLHIDIDDTDICFQFVYIDHIYISFILYINKTEHLEISSILII